MPELPEVETVRRTMRHVLKGKRIVKAEIVPDDIVLSGFSAEQVKAALEGRVVTEIGRHGKYWWLEFAEKPWVYGHLGMSGWIREIGAPTVRLREHGNAPLDDKDGRPKFLKMLLEAEDGGKIAFTDGRRLARLWLSDTEKDRRVAKLGRDVYDDLPSEKEMQATLGKRNAPIKALLLDQVLFPGIGNWIADEVLYHAKISPKRPGSSLTAKEVGALRSAIQNVINRAVGDGADKDKYPESWLFHHRWGGAKGSEVIDGNQIVRETVGGRTTAWVPTLQK